MSDLYQVGGTVCAKPKICDYCNANQAVHFEPIRCSEPTRNRIIGSCDDCFGRLQRYADWAKNNPGLAWELNDLTYSIYQAEGFLGEDYEYGGPSPTERQRIAENIDSMKSRVSTIEATIEN